MKSIKFTALLLSSVLFSSAAWGQAVFDYVDTNKDGLLSKKEVTAERLSRFKSLDLNSDNIIDRRELMVGPKNGKGMTDEQIQASLIAYDLDKDGQIALWELDKALEIIDIFSGMDINKDNVITREEAVGSFDIRQTGGTAVITIIQDLAQGLRENNGFRVISLNPQTNSIPMRRAPTQENPNYDSNGLMIVDNSRSAPIVSAGSSGSTAIATGRSGYVARTRDPVGSSSSFPKFFENQKPPEAGIAYSPAGPTFN